MSGLLDLLEFEITDSGTLKSIRKKKSKFEIKKLGSTETVEAAPGMLVMLLGPPVAMNTLARVHRVYDYGEEAYIGVISVHSDGALWNEYRILPRDVRWVSSDPPVVQDKGPALFERIGHLVKNVTRAIERLDAAGKAAEAELLQRFLNAIALRAGIPSEHRWFWITVAESLMDPRKLSCAATMEYVDNDNRRKCISISRFLKSYARQYGFMTTDEEADKIAHLVGCHFPKSYEYSFEVVDGRAVFDTYNEPDDIGSCMSGEAYPWWYALNKGNVSIVRIMLQDIFVGRALLWHTDQGVDVLDRVYPSDEGPHTIAIHNFAEEQGWDYKTYQNAEDGCLHSGRMDYTVTMRTSGDCDLWTTDTGYPYLDTFKYTYQNPAYDDPIILRLDDGAVVFNQTDGYWEDTDSCSCTSCGDGIDEDEAYTSPDGDYYCDYCYHERWVDLDYRHGDEWVDRTVRVGDARECDCCNEDRLSAHLQSVGDERWCEGCVEDEASRCNGCQELVSNTNIREIAGKDYCDSCVEVCETCGDDTPCNAPCEECKHAADLVAV